jgi:hypothetical protein
VGERQAAIPEHAVEVAAEDIVGEPEVGEGLGIEVDAGAAAHAGDDGVVGELAIDALAGERDGAGVVAGDGGRARGADVVKEVVDDAHVAIRGAEGGPALAGHADALGGVADDVVGEKNIFAADPAVGVVLGDL